MIYLISILVTAFIAILLVLGYWKYILASLVLLAVISIPFVWKAKAMTTGQNKFRMIIGALGLLILFIVIIFVAAIAINFLFWYLFKHHPV
ncbi:MAG: hypothetical protein WCV63_01160 [Negativicutes bacterium]|jgi:hypothetical protein